MNATTLTTAANVAASPSGDLIPVKNLITGKTRYYKREYLEKFDVLRAQLERWSPDGVLNIYEDQDAFHKMMMHIHYKTPIDEQYMTSQLGWIKKMLTKLLYNAEIEIQYCVAYSECSVSLGNQRNMWYKIGEEPKLFQITTHKFNGGVVAMHRTIVVDYRDEVNKLRELYGTFTRFEIDATNNISRIEIKQDRNVSIIVVNKTVI